MRMHMMEAMRVLYVVGAPIGRFAGVGAFAALDVTLAFTMAFAASCAALMFFAGLLGPFGVSGMTHIPHSVELIAV
jgi:hypothetical protein